MEEGEAWREGEVASPQKSRFFGRALGGLQAGARLSTARAGACGRGPHDRDASREDHRLTGPWCHRREPRAIPLDVSVASRVQSRPRRAASR